MERRELMAARVSQAAAAKPQQPILIASMGDSLTDEYTFENLNTIPLQSLNRATDRNWVSMLVATRVGQLSFGQYSAVDRGGTRQRGFAQDWARSGAAAAGTDVGGGGTTFVNQYLGSPTNGTPGLLTQRPNATGDVDPKSIKVVTMYIGTNDYNLGISAYATTNGQLNVFDAEPGMTNAVNARIEDALSAAIGKIRTTIPKAKIVIITPQDVTTAPKIAETYGAVPGLFAKATSSLATLNADVARIAKRQKLGFVNLQAMGQQLGAAPVVGGVAIDPRGAGPDIEDAFVADRFHYGTVMQGKIGQAVVRQIDALYGKDVIAPISDADIIAYARAIKSGVAVARTPSPAGPSRATVTATVTAGLGNASIPTGTVTFEAIGAASAANPVGSDTVLGTVAVDAAGRATLDVPAHVADTTSIYAVYSGDELHGSRASAGLAPFALTT